MNKLNPNNTFIKGASEIPIVPVPAGNGNFFYYDGQGKLKQSPLSTIYGMVDGVKGALKIHDAKPTVIGKYQLADVGVYANLIPIIHFGDTEANNDPITTEEDYVNYIYYDGVNCVEIKTLVQNSPINELIYSASNPVNSKAVLDFLETTNPLGELIQYYRAGFSGQSIMQNITPTQAVNINEIEGYFVSAGNLIVHVYNNKTDDPDNDNFIFRKRTSFTVAIASSGYQKVSVPTIQINPGDYLMVDALSTAQPYYTAGSSREAYHMSNGGSEYSYGLLTDLDLSIVFNSLIERYALNDDKVVNKIVVERNVADYNSIRGVVNSITDASEKNQYIVSVPAGEWKECDLFAKDFVTIVGAGILNTIIINDPLGSMSSKLTPSDYYFPGESNKQLHLVDKQLRHILNVRGNTRIENLTLYAKDCKYPAHIDDSNYKSFYAKNVRFKSENCNFPIGIGFGGGQDIKFENCIIERVDGPNVGVFVHNRNNQKEAGYVTFERCKFQNCNLAVVDELGSDHQDIISFINCFMSDKSNGYLSLMVDKDSDGKTFWINPATGIKEPNPANVPYCMVLNTAGTPIQTIVSADSTDFNPVWAGIPQRNIATVKAMSLIQEA